MRGTSNALTVNYAQCRAPITFLNGLSPPTQPTPSNGALSFTYSYSISDGVTYSVQSSLTVTTSSPFANTRDMLGNRFQTIVNITGTRTYTFLPTLANVTSAVTGLANVSRADLRFYTYAYLLASPGVYTTDNASFLDGDGFAFTVSPAVPALGLSVGSAVYSTVNFFLLVNSTTSTAVLSEGRIATSAPISTLQRQTYLFG